MAHSHLDGIQEMVEVVRLVVNHSRLCRMADLEMDKNRLNRIINSLPSRYG
jgi:hypothetical protein